MQPNALHRLIAVLILLLAALPAWANPDGIAVIVGNRDYGAGIPQVRFALNDAAAMRRFAIDVLGYAEGNVMLLENASQAELYATFGSADSPRGRLWGWAKPGVSDITVFYSGHGVPGRGDGRGYLLPVDADPDTPEINGYPLDLLYRNLAAIGARSTTVYLEACFSGDSAGGSLCRNCSGLTVLRRSGDVPAGLTVVSAAAADQVASWDEDAELGLFTHYLLKGLYGEADKDGDRRVVLGEVKAWLDAKMTYAARRQYRREQVAAVAGDGARSLVDIPTSATAFRIAPRFSVDALSERRTVTASGAINVRSGPGTGYPKVAWLHSGDWVDVNGRVVGAPWVRIALSGGRVGYVFADLLGSLAEAVPRVTADAGAAIPSSIPVKPRHTVMMASLAGATVHREPTSEADRIGTIPEFRLVSVVGEVDGGAWLQVRMDSGKTGFVVAGMLRNSIPAMGADKPASAAEQGFDSFRDCPRCPEMIVIPAGHSLGPGTPGSVQPTAAEIASGSTTSVPKFAVGRFEVTKAEFAHFVQSTNWRTATGCSVYAVDRIAKVQQRNWRDPGIPQTLNHPVVCLGWSDATAYAAWLRRTTGNPYRLLSSVHWRYAASGGRTSITPWQSVAAANQTFCLTDNMFDLGNPHCNDGFAATAPVGRFQPNRFGLHDMLGNVAEWVDNCSDALGRPRDEPCHGPVVIGGSWSSPPQPEEPGHASYLEDSSRFNFIGFRVMRLLYD